MSPGSAAATEPPLRILVAGTSWPETTFVERLLIGLADRGHAVTLRSRDRPPTAWRARHAIEWLPVDGLSRATVARALRREGLRGAMAVAAGSVLDRLRPAGASHVDGWDVVYVPWLNALIAEPGLFDLGAPVVTSCRGSLVTIAPWDPDRPEHGDDLRRVFARCELVHCVSDAISVDTAEFGLDPAKARVIRPAVDPAAFAPTSRPDRSAGTPVRILAVGGLNWTKDYESAILAVDAACRGRADVTLDIVGKGHDAQHLRFVVDDLDLGDRVRLRGRLEPTEVAAELGRADVFLHTSSSEGISNAVLEAMASGLPVITTDTGGMAEAVRHGVDGYLVGVRDIAAMTDAMVDLLGDGDLRRRMGEAARERVLDRFRLDDQITAFEALLRDAVDGGRSR